MVYFLPYQDICTDVWVGQLLAENRARWEPCRIVQAPALLAALFMRLLCSVFPAVCSGVKCVLSCVG